MISVCQRHSDEERILYQVLEKLMVFRVDDFLHLRAFHMSAGHTSMTFSVFVDTFLFLASYALVIT